MSRRSTALAVLGMVCAALLVSLSPATARAAGPCRPGQGMNLRGKDFTQGAPLPYDLRCADLTGAKLDGVRLVQKMMEGAILRKASLREADLTQARLEYADLRGADLREADLGQMQADHADLRGAILIDADAGQAQFPHADLTGAKLTRAVLTQANFTNAKLVDADLEDATPGQIKGRRADFTRANLREAKLGQANLQHAIFKDADLREAEFTQAELDDANFTGANIQDASFTGADDVDLTGAKGTPKGLPEGVMGLPPTELQSPEIDDTPSTPTRTSAAAPLPTTRGGLPVGFVLVMVGTTGLILTLLSWTASHQRRRREAMAFARAWALAEEDVIRFGEEIDRLDFEFQISGPAGPSADRHWRHALDAYDAAKNALTHARTPDELAFVARAVHDGRAALGHLRGQDRIR